jgi:hypothetical protein
MVSKFDIRNALKIQTKMVAAGLLAMMAVGPLTGCNSPTVPLQPKFGATVNYQNYAKSARTVAFDKSAPYKVAALSGQRQLLSYNDGSRVVGGVPFFKQSADNTCAQATTCVVLNYWGVKQDYQALVDMQNHFNLATHYTKIVEYMKSKGLDAKAYRQGNVGFLKQLIDQGRPPIVLLEFNNDLMQQHYITVVGYNQAKGTIIFHDSIDGPYRQMNEDDFTEMWQSKHLANLPILGGSNYQGLIIEASKAASN